MFESLLCFLNEVPSWLNQEHCALLFLSSFSLILPQRVLLIDKIRLLWNIFHISEDVCKTWAGCKGSWNYAQVFEGGGRWGFYGLLLRGWSIAGVFGIQCFYFVFVFFLRGWRGDSCRAPVSFGFLPPDLDWPSATSPCCVFLKTNERLTL